MLILESFFMFWIGASLASFLVALIHRYENNLKFPDIFTQSSSCDNCSKRLRWYELLPVFSYFITQGKCSQCGKRYSALYPITEFVLGVNFAVLMYSGAYEYMYILSLIVFFFAVYDLVYMYVPKMTMDIVLGISFLLIPLKIIFINETGYEVMSLIEGFGIFALLSLINLFKKAFGKADLFLFLILGNVLTRFETIKIFVVAFVIGALLAIILMIFDKKQLNHKYLPFLPFIYIAYLLVGVFRLW